MEIGKLERDEIAAMRSEEELNETEIEIGKSKFEKQLFGGMGEAMINELQNPTPPDKKTGRKMRRNRKWNIMKENFKRIIGIKQEAEPF